MFGSVLNMPTPLPTTSFPLNYTLIQSKTHKKNKNNYFQLLRKKLNFISSRKQPKVPSYYNFQFRANDKISNHALKQTRVNNREIKNKTHSDKYRYILQIFRHNEAYSGVIRAYPGTFRTPCYSVISRTLVHSEPHAYSEP